MRLVDQLADEVNKSSIRLTLVEAVDDVAVALDADDRRSAIDDVRVEQVEHFGHAEGAVFSAHLRWTASKGSDSRRTVSESSVKSVPSDLRTSRVLGCSRRDRMGGSLDRVASEGLTSAVDVSGCCEGLSCSAVSSCAVEAPSSASVAMVRVQKEWKGLVFNAQLLFGGKWTACSRQQVRGRSSGRLRVKGVLVLMDSLPSGSSTLDTDGYW